MVTIHSYYGLFFKVILGIITFAPAGVMAQSHKADSLLQHLTFDMPDTQRVQLLYEISEATQDTNKGLSLQYARKSLNLANSINYRKGMATAETQIGDILFRIWKPDSSLIHFRNAIDIAESAGLKAELAAAYTDMGMMFFFNRQYDTALALQERALDMEIALGNTDRQILQYNYIASIYGSRSDYIMSLKNFYKAIELCDENKHRQSLIRLSNNIGMTYYFLGDTDKALQYYEKGLGYTSARYSKYTGLLKNNIGHLWLSTGKADRAIYEFKEVLQFYSDGDDCQKSATMVELAMAFYVLGNLDSTLIYGNKGLEGVTQCQYKERELQAWTILGKANTALDNLQLAEEQLLKSVSYEGLDITLHSESLLALSQLYEKQGQFEKSLEYYKLYNGFQDSIFSDKNARGIALAELEHQFTTARELLQAKQENDLLRYEQEISGERAIRNYLVVSFILFLGLAYILFQSYRRKKIANNILKEKNRTILNQQEELMTKANLLRASNSRINELSEFKERLAHMAVHDMKNPLNTIIGLSAKGSEPTSKNLKMIHKSSMHMLNFVTNMLDIYKFEQATIALDLSSYRIRHLVDEAREQVDSLLREKNISLIEKGNPDLTGTLDGVIIIRVLVNILINAIRYSEVGSTVYLEVCSEKKSAIEQWLKIVITDEGEGISPDLLTGIFEEFNPKKPQHITKSASTGIGLNFCKLAVKAHKGSISAKSKLGKGTSITIKLPLQHENLNTNPFKQKETKNREEVLILKREIKVIKHYSKKLEGIKVHEVGKINAILMEMEEKGMQSQWKERLQGTIYAGNQEAFNQLIYEAQNLS